jgi:hypothetical protein
MPVVTLDGGEFARATCPRCSVSYYLPHDLYQVAYRRRPEMSVWCPNGHTWVFSLGESELDMARRERDRLRQKLAEKDDEIRQAKAKEQEWHSKALAAGRESGRLKKRAAAGVCPCCNRTVQQMARHMKTAHPTYLAEATA